MDYNCIYKFITTYPVFHIVFNTATTTLASSLNGRQTACPGTLVTYTCTVTQGVVLEWTAEPFITESNRRQFSSTAAPEDRVLSCRDFTSPVQCADFDYQATLTSVSTIQNRYANMTSTVKFTARVMVNGTVVQCKGLTATGVQMASHILNVTGVLWHIQCAY